MRDLQVFPASALRVIVSAEAKRVPGRLQAVPRSRGLARQVGDHVGVPVLQPRFVHLDVTDDEGWALRSNACSPSAAASTSSSTTPAPATSRRSRRRGGDDDDRALAREPIRHRTADPGSRARDERHASLETSHAGSVRTTLMTSGPSPARGGRPPRGPPAQGPVITAPSRPTRGRSLCASPRRRGTTAVRSGRGTSGSEQRPCSVTSSAVDDRRNTCSAVAPVRRVACRAVKKLTRGTMLIAL